MGTGLPPCKEKPGKVQECYADGVVQNRVEENMPAFIPNKIQHNNEIKDVLEHQLVNLRRYNTDPRAPYQD